MTTKNTCRVYELPENSKVVIRDSNSSGYVNVVFLRMNSRHKGVWDIAGIEFEGNMYGNFHYNSSQNYFYYEEADMRECWGDCGD